MWAAGANKDSVDSVFVGAYQPITSYQIAKGCLVYISPESIWEPWPDALHL